MVGRGVSVRRQWRRSSVATSLVAADRLPPLPHLPLVVLQGLAHEAKERGNAAFKRGEAFYGHALKYYRDCLEHAGEWWSSPSS